MPRARRFIASIACYLVICGLPLLAAFPASAVLVSVNGTEYDVTFFAGSHDDHSSLFKSPPAGLMPWWDDVTGMLALEFAFQVYDGLGEGSYAGSGPMFAYLLDPGTSTIEGWVQSLTDPNSQDIQTPLRNASVTYAILNPLPVPLPPPVLGALAAFRVSRGLRRRQRLHAATTKR